MGRELKRLKKRKRTLSQIDSISDHPDNTFVIHYSCESFYDIKDGHTPRVTSIAIRNLDSGQTESFSIHKVAERQGIDQSDIDKQYDGLEREMLNEYFDFLRARQGVMYIHWNMRDGNYGFHAIEHRYQVLGGEPYIVDDSRKFDLSRALVSLYGIGYIGHRRLEKLIEKNKITTKDFLSGEDEAAAFDNKEFVKLHQSTLRKADVLANIFERTSDNSIKTNATWREIHGITPQTLIELIKEHWLWSAFVIIAITVGFVIKIKEFF